MVYSLVTVLLLIPQECLFVQGAETLAVDDTYLCT